MVPAIERPKLEGNIAVGPRRRLGFAEFGDPQGRAVFWLHGTPGARRQIPTEARVFAEQPTELNREIAKRIALERQNPIGRSGLIT